MQTVRSGLSAAVLTGAVLLGVAPVASAHVRADVWGSAAPGHYATVVLRVPNEQESARSTGIVLRLPAEHPLAEVSTQPVPGWRAQVTKRRLPQPKREGKLTLTEAPSTVSFTADPGAGTPPGQFQTFWLSLGPLPPDTDVLHLPTEQRYDNGRVVDWATPARAGAAEPDHPAPQITVAGTSRPRTTAQDERTGDGIARLLGGLGVGIGVLGLGLAIGVLLRQRRVNR
ncbi:YcnI family protein [Sciscionella marina]|uniref:YcnI family copper-binding membrane protein n=1 Tax=Sciscionella marina TaxID=508770 RepID=UPI000478193E|nr:YcnI family protein [Sciscionella marina]